MIWHNCLQYFHQSKVGKFLFFAGMFFCLFINKWDFPTMDRMDHNLVKFQTSSWKAKRNTRLCHIQSCNHHSRATVTYYLTHRITFAYSPLCDQQTIGTAALSGREIGFPTSTNEKYVSVVVAVFTNSVIIYLNQIPALSIYFTLLFKSGQASFYCPWIAHAEPYWCSGKQDSDFD